MEILSGIALVLLTLVGYSSGIVLARGVRQVLPDVIDLATVAVLWVAALATREPLGHWRAIGVWIVGGLIAGAIAAHTRRREAVFQPRYPTAAPASAEPNRARRRALEAWKRFALRMGNFQGRMIMGFFYFVVVAPFALLGRLAADPLRLRRTAEPSYWVEREPLERSVDAARRQF